MWNRVSEAWQGRVNIWQICPHTETERSNRRSDRKTTKTVAVSALFELLLLLCRCAAAPHVLQAFYSQNCLGGWRQAPSPLIQLEHKPENFKGRKFRGAERMTGPAGDLNRCTSGLICTSRVDGCLSVTDNLEINLTDYLLITGATIHFNWTYF